jgi:hypothetical protein
LLNIKDPSHYLVLIEEVSIVRVGKVLFNLLLCHTIRIWLVTG